MTKKWLVILLSNCIRGRLNYNPFPESTISETPVTTESFYSFINWGSHRKMTVDENFAKVMLRNPRKMSVDKNHTWDKIRFFKISHCSVTYKKNHLKMTRLTSLVIWSNLGHSPTDHSKDAKKDSKMTRWNGLANRYSWMKSRLFNRKINRNS